MKFKKYGKVYDTATDMIKCACRGNSMNCDRCNLLEKREQERCSCIGYAEMHPEESARLLGFEVIEDTPDIREAVEKYSEDAKPDPVNHPAHYTSGGIECIDAMQAAFGDDAVKGFCLCNAFKYLWRHRQKNGVEDLKKARWYLNRLITEMEVEDDDT